MARKIFKHKKPKTVDAPLDKLETIKAKKEAIIADEAATINEIRNGFVEVVVMFIDMVDSTKFKTENQTEPEKWILRVRQFSEIVGQYITACDGKIVKYIGDEVMAVFTRDSKINDAINLLNRINEMQRDLSEITGAQTTVKIALDFGNAFFINYEGHIAPDPQGTPVDRCARIAKYCKPGIVLTSFELVTNSETSNQWEKVGEVDLKGLGMTGIYQFGKATIELIPHIEIPEPEYKDMKAKINKQKSENESLTLKIKEAEKINTELNLKLKTTGKKVDPALVLHKDSKEDKCAKDWEDIKNKITALKKIINNAPVPPSQYARFLFLHKIGSQWKYDSFTDNKFDESIESQLLTECNEGYYELDSDNRRNTVAIELMDELEFHLDKYNQHCRTEEQNADLYDYSLKAPEFWQEKIGYHVTL